jgi:hypothetical protein
MMDAYIVGDHDGDDEDRSHGLQNPSYGREGFRLANCPYRGDVSGTF